MKNKKGKSCTWHRFRNTFEHEEVNIAHELYECLDAEIYADAFVFFTCSSIIVLEFLKPSRALQTFKIPLSERQIIIILY